ncbi:MAG: exodeoxyribonuclease VII large subunit [Oscillospiraceae bacterium]|nr:exodeoxyribonuclease VII large subunit [Oscillospiraceae bacterium]MBQ5339575.1 exodeoxyribonuclease VII large subunit [Oscillospiraceae bacterium]
MSILSVSQLNRYVAFRLQEDQKLRTVLVRGELANFTRNFRSGHCYFSIRDEEASVKAVMFRSNADRLPFEPENGMHVILQGSVTLYERDGAYQINVTDMQPDGVGAQALALQQRREKLAKLGYFAPERKRPIPVLPQKIGIVTSRSGAALHDMLQILERRYPVGTVCIYPALVQGDAAPASIAEALRTAGKDGCDLILMGRGGGSNEDLSAFQSEEVASAVFLSPVPVISAVGHETDHCIADEVADLRAPTPSAAAELAVPETAALKDAVTSQAERMRRAMQNLLDEKSQALLEIRQRLTVSAPEGRLKLLSAQLDTVTDKLHRAFQHLLHEKYNALSMQCERLEAYSPVAILQRGYALVYHDNQLVRDADTLHPDDTVTLRLANGTVVASVTEIRKEEPK